MRDFLLIYVNGQRHEVRGSRVFQSLSDFLRYDLRLTGTKIVCAEGDCGSCSVFVGTPAGGRIEYRSVTSCIQLLCQVDCKHVVTVEGLQYEGQLNPVQESLVRCQGSQCGFCTPGFVVSLCAMFEERRGVGEADVNSACVGNLCRCTGYEPIIRAGIETDASKYRPLGELYPAESMLGDVERHARDEVLIRHGERTWFKPISVASASAFKAREPECVIVSGGTDLGVAINKGLRDPKTFMSLSALAELREIARGGDMLVIGGAASLTDMLRVCADSIPEYARLLYWFGSPPIRNAATLGGNIANGSPIGDTMPALFVLNAEVELTGASGSRRVNINDFYTGYKKNVAAADELITRVFIPLPPERDIFKLYKVSRRKDLDISAFTAAIWMQLDSDVISDIRIAYGGVGPMIIRLKRTQEFMRGRRFDCDTVSEAGEIARQEISPISDVRGSADYRAQLAENILKKFFNDVTGLTDGDENGRHDGDGRHRAPRTSAMESRMT